jgi:hypothetical protein
MPLWGPRIRACLSAALLLFAASPGLAQDDAEKTGIAAGLGLTAASGKTTMSGGAGAIEASLLDSDAMLKAGATIRQLALAARTDPNRKLLIIAKADTIDFSMALWVMQRMVELNRRASALSPRLCSKPPVLVEHTIQSSGGGRFKGLTEDSATSDTKKFGFARTDIVAALASEISIGAIALSADDRTLIKRHPDGRCHRYRLACAACGRTGAGAGDRPGLPGAERSSRRRPGLKRGISALECAPSLDRFQSPV